MRFATALFSALLTPALALAQTVVPAPAGSAAVVIQPAGVSQDRADAGWRMPLWSTSDGRILALVALGGGHGAPVLPQAPQIGSAADWQLIDVTHFVGGGLSCYFCLRAIEPRAPWLAFLLSLLYSMCPGVLALAILRRFAARDVRRCVPLLAPGRSVVALEVCWRFTTWPLWRSIALLAMWRWRSMR